MPTGYPAVLSSPRRLSSDMRPSRRWGVRRVATLATPPALGRDRGVSRAARQPGPAALPRCAGFGRGGSDRWARKSAFCVAKARGAMSDCSIWIAEAPRSIYQQRCLVGLLGSTELLCLGGGRKREAGAADSESISESTLGHFPTQSLSQRSPRVAHRSFAG